MPALPSQVTDYLTAIKTSLQQGSDLGSNVRGAALNYLRAQDLATVLDLLQDAMDSGTLTAVSGGSTTSVQAGDQATEVLTFTGQPTDGETVTIDTKVYTFEDTLTDVDGNVQIGASTEESQDNLVAAVNLGAGSGTAYAASMTLHPTVSAADGAGTTLDATAKLSGTAGNSIATTDNVTNADWGAATMSGGRDAFAPNEQVGNVVVFASNTTTAALRDEEARVRANTVGVLTLEDTLPATPVAGDTFVVRGGWFDSAVDELRGSSASLADAPRGDVYGDQRTAADAFVTALRRRGTPASETLTLSANAADSETVTIDAKVYTFEDTLTDVDGNVLVGADADESISNLVAAITLGAGSGTAYAASTTLHPTATAVEGAGDTMVASAQVAGTEGNSLATTETMGSGAWGDTTMSGGTIGGSGTVAERTMSHPSLQTGAGSTTTVVQLDLLGGTVNIDEFRGLKISVSGETPRIVVSNTADGACTVSSALSSAPAASTATTLTIPVDDVGGTSAPKIRTHPGAQPGENAALADLIQQVEDLMAAYSLST
jgi:hypothetical protein